MIKKIVYKNWKSFAEGELIIDPITILIGTNASGKSNVIDGINLLGKISQGESLAEALIGDSLNKQAIRGGSEWAAKKPNKSFTIECEIEVEEKEYKYSVTIKSLPTVELVEESLILLGEKPKTLYTAKPKNAGAPSIIVSIYNGKGVSNKEYTKKEYKRSYTVLSQLKNQIFEQEELKNGIRNVSGYLEGIFTFDPIPSLMREYKPLSDTLLANASNIAGMLAAQSKEKREELENQIIKYLKSFPENDIKRVWVETVGKFKSDAMLYCEEKWGEKDSTIMDARGMSDGTLRFIGILIALLTREEKSLILIEEIDNGLHPSRAKLLIEVLKDIGLDRGVDIILTTHNPALLDSFGIPMLSWIRIVNRNSEDGSSKIEFLEDIENLPKLLASASLGKLATQGKFENVNFKREVKE